MDICLLLVHVLIMENTCHLCAFW